MWNVLRVSLVVVMSTSLLVLTALSRESTTVKVDSSISPCPAYLLIHYCRTPKLKNARLSNP